MFVLLRWGTFWAFGMDGWPPHRVVRDDGEVVESWSVKTEVSVGMVAGFPSAEQYEDAARVAFDSAAEIRRREGSRR